MMSDYIVANVTMIALVFTRVGGFMLLSPFPGAWVPVRVRAGLLMTLSITIGVLIAPAKSPVPLGPELLPVAASDFAIGLFIGASFRFVISSAEFMAGLVSQASWLSAPIAMNPEMGGQSPALGQVSTLLSILLALGLGMHRVVIAYLLESFAVMPIGVTANVPEAVPTLIELVGTSFDMGMRLALPVLAVSLAVQTALALISRVAPSLQIFSIGFAVLVGTGLITFMISLPSIAAGLLQYMGTIPDVIEQVLEKMATPS